MNDRVTGSTAFQLVRPSRDRLPGYVAALRAGWSPDTTRDVTADQLAVIEDDADAFLRLLRGEMPGTVRLADGRAVARLPGQVFWMWDGEFCGSINLRYQPGTETLPPHVSGHAGFAVAPWKRSRGYATRALALLLPIARDLGLPRLLLTCDADNVASRRVIEANGGVLDDEEAGAREPDKRKLRFWVGTGPRAA